MTLNIGHIFQLDIASIILEKDFLLLHWGGSSKLVLNVQKYDFKVFQPIIE